jgi:hypothetical protein
VSASERLKYQVRHHQYVPDWTTEFAFELRVCGWAEREWPPDGSLEQERVALVGRQLGTRRRRWDTIVAIADREALQARAALGPEHLDRELLRVVRNAPSEWQWYREVLPEWADWRYVREHLHRAADRDLVETRREGSRLHLRRRHTYPDWCEGLIAIENKPDLDASAATALAGQLEYDVALGLADEVWIATLATDDRVEPALLTERPVEAGVLTVDPEALSATVHWQPTTLAVEEPGTRILERPGDGVYDDSAARFEYVSPQETERYRRVIAERLYERGWRSYVESMRPDCRSFGLAALDGQYLPRCATKDCCPTAAECSNRCPSFEPEPPHWRTKRWPIEGGPGTRQRALLEERRARQRPPTDG